MRELSKQKVSGIYKITCISTGKVYIGSTIDLKQREATHFNLLRTNKNKCTKLQYAFNKYGEVNFVFSVIESPVELDILRGREEYYIKLYDSARLGMNVAESATQPNLGIKFTDEHKKKIGLSKIGKKRPDVSLRFREINKNNIGSKNHFYGKRHSVGTKLLMREGKKNKISNGSLTHIIQLHLVHKIPQAEIAKVFGVCQQYVSRIIVSYKAKDEFLMSIISATDITNNKQLTLPNSGK